jgi:phosphatidylglycerol:prolipoprotein diacylglycerol transferase
MIIALGLVLAVVYALRRCNQFGFRQDDILDGVLWIVPVSVICARLYNVFAQWDYYGSNLKEIINIRGGGLAIYGAVIGAAVCVILPCKSKKINLPALLDLVALGFLIGQAVGRWGNFMNREAFGGETTLPWRMELTLRGGDIVQVHPTFFYESLWNVIGLVLIVLVVSKVRRFDGQNTCFYFLWYGIGRFWIEGLRTDSLYLFDWQLFGQPIRVSQALSLAMIVVSLVLLVYHLKIRPHDPAELYVNRVAAEKAQKEAQENERTDP